MIPATLPVRDMLSLDQNPWSIGYSRLGSREVIMQIQK